MRRRQDTPPRSPGRPAGRVTPAVTYGLLAAWAAHDLEEVLAFGPWARHAMPRLRERYPGIPGRVWRTVESVDEREFAVAVALVGAVMAAAAAAGQATGGRSRLFQLTLAGFGLHAAGHCASAAVVRGYAPGLVTAPLVAAPFSAWAIRRLKAAGVWRPLSADDIIPKSVLALTLLGGSHLLARILVGRKSALRGHRAQRAAYRTAASPRRG
jgi:hypothetical protein